MGHTNNIIEVNGKRYDAVTGVIINDIRPSAKPAAAVHTRQHTSRRSLDGFARVNRDQLPAKPKTPLHTVLDAVIKQGTHNPASHTAPHKPQRAVTLMRTAVKKPDIKAHHRLKAHTRTDLLAKKPTHIITPKQSYGSLNQVRHQRAQQMVKSSSVSHFNQPRLSQSVQPTPAHPRQATRGAGSLEFISTTKPAALKPAVPIGLAPHTSYRTARPYTQPAVPASSSDIFEQALAMANSHEQTFESPRAPKVRRRRGLAFVSVSLLLLLLVGFFGYQNAPQISLKVASYRAGLHAKLPTYQPGDYAFDHLDYKPGTVTAMYTSTSGDEQLNINQRASNWDSQALLSNVVSTAKSGYKTYQSAGRTVYVLSNNTATWVDSGILYTVEGNASLSSQQLLDLASSM